MHSITDTGFRPQAFVDPGELAANHNLPQLMWQLALQNVNLNTLNDQGVTLLMEAVRQHNPDALFLLLEDCLLRGIAPDLMHQDHQNNTVLHYMAMHLPDAWFDEPSDQPVLANMLEQFFNDLREEFDWERHNAQGLTAVELAQTAQKANLVGFLQTYEVTGEDTSTSNSIESSHSYHDSSDEDGDPGSECNGLLV